jgi:NADH-quinone oxidoreductase subunit M
MNELHFPWIESGIGILCLGALFVSRVPSADAARRWSIVFSSIALLLMIGLYADFRFLLANDVQLWEAHDPFDVFHSFFGTFDIAVDNFSVPLMPLTALLYLLTTVATLRTKVRRFSFALTLLSESIVLATFCCESAWGIIALASLATVPPYFELRAREKPTRVYVIHMAAFIALMVIGHAFVIREEGERVESLIAAVPLLLAIFVRSGIAPFHCWMTDLFENATFGTALLFAAPLTGAYLAVRLVFPIAPDWMLRSLGIVSIITVVYAAGMALVQKEARRFYCYIFLSHSALVLVGMETATVLGLTGALCVWLSVGLALSGFGLTMRALEARHGRLELTRFRGLYEHTPALAICFLLTGLASVGFPGTFGFIGMEMLVDATVNIYPLAAWLVVLAAALNGIAIVKAYFLLFTGTRHASPVSLRIGQRERFAVLLLATLIILGGLMPQVSVNSRFRAAEHLLAARFGLGSDPESSERPGDSHHQLESP